MRIEEFRRVLDKRAASRGLEVAYGPPASPEALRALAERLGGPLPWQVELFWAAHDGLVIQEPALCVLSCDRWAQALGFVHFATIDGQHRLGFDTRSRNVADEWNIVHIDTGFLVTLTMASFWSNKVLAWVDTRRCIWAERGRHPS